MGDSHNSKPGSRPGGSPPPAQGPAVGQKPAAMGEKPVATNQNSPESPDQFAGKSGRVIHDARGNAVWDWVKETSRIAIDSTSRLLKRLEVPELKMEDTQPNKELSVEADRDSGGGYDPYGGSTSGKGGASRGAQRRRLRPVRALDAWQGDRLSCRRDRRPGQRSQQWHREYPRQQRRRQRRRRL